MWQGIRGKTMENYETVHSKIRTETTGEIQEVFERYLEEFGEEVGEFIEHMSIAFMSWQTLDSNVQGDEKKAYVSASVYNAITLQILSMRLLLLGYGVASGNLQRQVFEAIALAFLFSGKSVGVLERFMRDEYQTMSAMKDVVEYSDILHLNREGLEALKKGRIFYHNYSHPTKMTIASYVSFQELGLYVGASFDEGKVEAYRKEVEGRVSLASTFHNFVEGVKINLSQW
jgi:hypothetical protein